MIDRRCPRCGALLPRHYGNCPGHFVLARKRRRVTVPWYSRLPVSPEALAVFRASAAIEFWLGGDV